MKKSEIVFGALRLPIDTLAALIAFWLAYYLRPITDLIPGRQYHFFPEQLPPIEEYRWLALFASVFLILLFAIANLYSFRVTHRFSQEFLKILFWVSAWVMFLIAYYFLVVHALFFSRIALAHIWFFTLLLVMGGRLLIRGFQWGCLKLGWGRERVLFVGMNELADEYFSILKKDLRLEVVGALAGRVESRPEGRLTIIGTFLDLEAVVMQCGITQVIEAEPEKSENRSEEILAFCRSHQIEYAFIPDRLRLQRVNLEVEMKGGMPLIRLSQTPLEGWGFIFKRLFDLGVSSLSVILLLPIWLLVPAMIRLGSRGPALYKSQRRYRDHVFNAYKFRSMVANADALKLHLLSQNERSGPLFKIKNDPRVTRIGKWLRKTSIDELPQLFNVLKGDMSLVGPRPHLPEEVERYDRHHYQVFALKPGLTGLAQVSGRSNLDFEEEVKLDLYYIENWSVWLDLKILLKTIRVVLRGEGH